MAAGTRRDLFLQIGGSADGLASAAKAGKTALLSLGSTAGDIVADVEKAWADLGKGGLDNGLKSMERSFTRTLSTFRANAQKVADAPTPAAATQILNVAGAEQAARAAEAEAAALRLLADSSSMLAQRSGAAGTAERVLATALAAQAVEARSAATALRSQANLLGAIASEAGIAVHREDALAESHGRMGTSGMMAEHVVRSLSDSIAAGASPVRALMMEMGRITESMSLYAQQTNATEGAMAKFAAFMGGPWGIAMSVGVAVLTPLIAGLIENEKDAEDAKKALQEYAGFMDDLGNFVDKATGKIVEQNKALIEGAKLSREGEAHQAAQSTSQLKQSAFDKARDYRVAVDPGTAAATAIAAAGAGGTVMNVTTDPKVSKVIADANYDLAKLLAGLKALSAQSPSYDNLYRSVLRLGTQAQKSYDDYHRLRGEISELDTVGAGGVVNSSALVDRHVAELTATTALEKATLRLNAVKERGAAIDRMDAGPAKEAALKSYQAEELAAQRAIDKAKEDAKAERHATSGENAASNQATDLAYMEAFLKRELPGVRITSTNGGKHVTNSDHYANRALDFVPAGGMSSMSKSDVRELFESNGLRIRRNSSGVEQLFGPGDKGHSDHFHVAWEGRAPTDAVLDKRSRTDSDKATRDAEAYSELMSRAQEETLKLTRDQVTDRAAIAELDVQSVELERQRLDGAAQAGANERKWTQAKADELKLQNDINADLKTRAIQQAESTRELAQEFATARADRDARDALLQIDVAMAGTRGQRLVAERQLLADRQQSRYDDLEKVVGDPATSKDNFDAAEASLARLPNQNAAEKRQLEQQYQSPMDSYRSELTKNVGDMGDALQSVEVGGIQSIQDGLLGIMNGTKSVAGAFRDMAASIIADIEKIAIEKVILSFLGLKDGGTVSGFAGGGLPGFAGGGDPSVSNGIISGPGTGTSDSILALVGRKPIRVGNGEAIVNEAGVKKHWPLIDAINHDRLPKFATGGLVDPSAIYLRSLPAASSLARQNQAQVIRVITEASPYFDTRVVQTASPLAQAAMVGGAQQAQQDIADRQMAAIP